MQIRIKPKAPITTGGIMLAYPPICVERLEKDVVRIIPLKADAVMCEMNGCERPARFLLKYKSGALRAVCEESAIASSQTGIARQHRFVRF